MSRQHTAFWHTCSHNRKTNSQHSFHTFTSSFLWIRKKGWKYLCREKLYLLALSINNRPFSPHFISEWENQWRGNEEEGPSCRLGHYFRTLLGVRHSAIFCPWNIFLFQVWWWRWYYFLNITMELTPTRSFFISRSLKCDRIRVHKHFMMSLIIRYVVSVIYYEPYIYGDPKPSVWFRDNVSSIYYRLHCYLAIYNLYGRNHSW